MNKKVFTILLFLLFTLQITLSASYVALIDAGSSGSRINLFDIQNSNGTLNISVIPMQKSKVTPGISNYIYNENRVYEHMAPLIDSLRSTLPSGIKEIDVDIYLLATAGMRVINPKQQIILYQNIENYLKTNTSLNVRLIETISGRKEGIFAWIALNYLEGAFNKKNTMGVIDVGGASAQVAYEDRAAISPYTAKVKIGASNYLVYSRSYLGIGADLMRSQFTSNPHCFPQGLLLSDVTGTGNFDECLFSIRPILTHVHKVDPIPGYITETTQFAGISNFYHITNSNIYNLGNKASINSLIEKGIEFSKMTWMEMELKWPNEHFLFSHYISTAFLIVFMQELGFPPDTPIYPLSYVDGQEISWTLGAVIYFEEGNK